MISKTYPQFQIVFGITLAMVSAVAMWTAFSHKPIIQRFLLAIPGVGLITLAFGTLFGEFRVSHGGQWPVILGIVWLFVTGEFVCLKWLRFQIVQIDAERTSNTKKERQFSLAQLAALTGTLALLAFWGRLFLPAGVVVHALPTAGAVAISCVALQLPTVWACLSSASGTTRTTLLASATILPVVILFVAMDTLPAILWTVILFTTISTTTLVLHLARRRGVRLVRLAEAFTARPDEITAT